MMKHPLPLRAYRKVSTERLVNCFPEQKPQDALGPVALVRAPGIATIANLGENGRGLAIFNGQLWAVAGQNLINVSTLSGAVIDESEIPGFAPVSMAATVDRLCVVTDGRAWLSDSGGTVTEITDTDFRTPGGAVSFIDNYLVFNEANSGRWFCSDLNAPESYDGTYFATAEFAPDPLVGLIADHGQVFLAGIETCELWQNDGSTGFPFARTSNGVIEMGCAAGRSLAKLDNSIFWLASDLTVRRLTGFTPLRISTHGIENIIATWGDVSSAYGMAWSYGGHLMYSLTVKDKGTVVYDATTNEWHERRSYGQNHWAVVAIAQYAEQVYALSEDGVIGIMDANTYSEFGDYQVVEWTHAPLYAEGRRVRLNSVELAVRTQ